ncbi:MAG: hypothetical protein B2I17_02890 [Thermoplasmatales archaeon B_DKE]|nr:MAG: hypothetical protein B2I17_03845 [Thermoplasmatales archaeon B_DKE]OWP57117.1 MAG: hypothetical protein B2I17_02890 [Thermoplasmatales archaeon B_DKE]
MEHHNYDRVRQMREDHIPFARIEELVNAGRGDVIIDFGSGDGFYAVKFAQLIGDGMVYAFEHNSAGVDAIRKNIASNGIKNVQIIEKDICSSDLPGGFNKVFFSNVFHDLDCQDKLLDQLGRVAGLEITFIEFKPDTPFGPPRDIRFSSEELAGKLGRHGFDLVKEIEFEYHYAQKYRARQNR